MGEKFVRSFNSVPPTFKASKKKTTKFDLTGSHDSTERREYVYDLGTTQLAEN